MKEIVIGFDAREMYESDYWTTPRFQIFLLREEIIKPLTADTMIWSSVFERRSAGEPRDYVSVRSHTWANLNDLKTRLLDTVKKPYWIIAITQLGTEGELARYSYYADMVVPFTIDNQWKFLGYDVTEETLLSGLTNMGYRPDQNPFAQAKYAASLNEYHLFTQVEIALDFVKWANQRDPGHGPFFVYGLYLVEIVNP